MKEQKQQIHHAFLSYTHSLKAHLAEFSLSVVHWFWSARDSRAARDAAWESLGHCQYSNDDWRLLGHVKRPNSLGLHSLQGETWRPTHSLKPMPKAGIPGPKQLPIADFSLSRPHSVPPPSQGSQCLLRLSAARPTQMVLCLRLSKALLRT